MESPKEDNKQEESLKVHSTKVSEPLRKEKRFTLPSKKLRIKAPAKEVLNMLTIEFLTPSEIAHRRKTSIRAVYKVIKKLKEKGLFDSGFNQVNLKRSTEPFSEPLRSPEQRLHGQEWNIKILQKSEKYAKARKNANTIFLDGNTIRLYQESLEVYSGQSFIERDEQRATAVSLAYWEAFFARIEHEFGIVIIKPRAQNINLVNQHYGEINSEMARDSLKRGEKFRFETDDDGKLWFTIDNSWNLKEMETLHPETAKQDMTKVQKQVNDWRANDPPTNSELAGHIMGLINVQEYHAENIKTHIAAIQELAQGVKELKEAVRGLKK